MIELRWVSTGYVEDTVAVLSRYVTANGAVYHKLQYRQLEQKTKNNWNYQDWSEWKDVLIKEENDG